MWGQNYEQPWVEQAWGRVRPAYTRMVEEARCGAHGVIGVVDCIGQRRRQGRPSSTSWARPWWSRAAAPRRRRALDAPTWPDSAWPS